MFKFKGISSEDMQVVIEEEEHFVARASQRYEVTEIEGRDGAIFDTLGYSYVERPIYVQCLNINKIDDILAWLDGEGEFEYKGRKTTARFYSQLEPQRSACLRIIDTTFIREPFWYNSNDEFMVVKEANNYKQVNGENITINDSSNMPFEKFKVMGNSKQENSPSSDSPSEIKNVTNINAVVCNKNLTNYKEWTRIGSVGSLSVEENKLIYNVTNNCYGLLDIERILKPNTAYTAYSDYKFTGEFGSQWGLRVRKNEMWEMPAKSNILNFTTDETGKITLAFYIATPYTGENAVLTLKNIRLYEGIYTIDNIPEYEPHQSQTFTFPLSEGQRLYKNSLLADDGIHHARVQIELDGTENIIKSSTLNRYLIAFDSNSKTPVVGGREVLCSHYRKANSITSEGIFLNDANLNSTSKFLGIVDNNFTTLEDFKSNLVQQKANGTPVIIEYELEEEIIELYAPEQQKVYDKIKEACSYKNTTHIFSTDKVSPVFEVSYQVDEKFAIINNGNIKSRPVLRIKKVNSENVDLTINDVRFKYDFCNEDYMEMDCEEKTVKYNNLNRNRQIKIGYKFPTLNIGENEIIVNTGDCIIEAKRKDRWL